ncbi:DUF5131 family protein [Streptomyces sp. IB201691-2A2]|nr:DUF5131 family protein [Streptomyces sp. IB201691-2A2]
MLRLPRRLHHQRRPGHRPTAVHTLPSPALPRCLAAARCRRSCESGPRARPLHPDWIRSLRDQIRERHVPFFFKLLCTNRSHTNEIERVDRSKLPRASAITLPTARSQLRPACCALRHRRKPKLSACGGQEVPFGRPELLKLPRGYVSCVVRSTGGGDLACTTYELVDGVHGRGPLGYEAGRRFRGFHPLHIRTPDFVEKRHHLSETCRMWDSRDVGGRVASEGHVFAIGRQEITVGSQSNVSPLTCMLTPPKSILASGGQPPAEQYGEQRDRGRDPVTDDVHRLESPFVSGRLYPRTLRRLWTRWRSLSGPSSHHNLWRTR